MSSNKIGLVIIGRNEARNLELTLPRLPDSLQAVVFVDSDSSDDSVAIAQANNVDVIELDMSKPFTAARARNTGFKEITEKHPELEYIQFLDGDCELDPDFLEKATLHFQQNKQAGIVVGRNRERYPEKTVYNTICDVEWNTPVGEIDGCGGIFMVNRSVFESVNGFNESIIAAEDTELCLRVRQAGYKISRIDAEMSLHDANMTTVKQWWRRSVRAGHAFADCRYRYRSNPERMFVKESQRSWIFGGYLFLVLTLMILIDWRFAILFLFYPIQMFRIRRGLPSRIPEYQRTPYAMSCALAYIPQLFGQIKFHINRLLNRQSRIIEHK